MFLVGPSSFFGFGAIAGILIPALAAFVLGMRFLFGAFLGAAHAASAASAVPRARQASYNIGKI